eukprot:6490932-Amphidinium_carterae.1
MFSEHSVKKAVNKELAQSIKKSHLKRSTTPQQLQQVVATKMGDHTTTNQQKDIMCSNSSSQCPQVVCPVLSSRLQSTMKSWYTLPKSTTTTIHTHTLWRVTKALYGLRASPKQWQEHLSTILQQLGFTRLKSDACVFANKPSTIYIMASVDDLQCHNTTVPTTVPTTLGVETHKSTHQDNAT